MSLSVPLSVPLTLPLSASACLPECLSVPPLVSLSASQCLSVSLSVLLPLSLSFSHMLLSMCSFFSHRLFSLFLLLPSATNVFLLLSDRSKELKTEISHTHSLILSHTVLIATLPARVDLWRLEAAGIGAVVQELSRVGTGRPSDELVSPFLVNTGWLRS